jgi:hypothetical protein
MGNSYISIRGEMMRKQVPIACSHPPGSAALPRSLSLTLDAHLHYPLSRRSRAPFPLRVRAGSG